MTTFHKIAYKLCPHKWHIYTHAADGGGGVITRACYICHTTQIRLNMAGHTFWSHAVEFNPKGKFYKNAMETTE